MSEPTPLQIVTTTVRTVSEDAVFAMLSEGNRRSILRALADGQLHHAPSIGAGGRLQRDLARKHMAALVKSGLVEAQPDPQNGNRQLYRLAPMVKVTTTPEGRMLDFGYCILRG